jgi:hypothetical protein
MLNVDLAYSDAPPSRRESDHARKLRRGAGAVGVAVFSLLFTTGACAPQSAQMGSGGSTGSGGSGSGGSGSGGHGSGGSASGGNVGTGGGNVGTGGSGSGGSGSGGVTETGGTSAGGTTGTGGTAGQGSGGITPAGGAAGHAASGGAGGAHSGGSGTGGAVGTGGVQAPTPCTLMNHSGSGSFTHYYFGMGTGKDGSGYRTACGYYGTEGGGSSSSGPNDMVENVASMSPASNKYFAAIPGQNGFDSRFNCGACVQITGQNGKMVIATIVDECPYGNDGGNTVCGNNPNGHLDLSTAVFDQLGYSVGNPTGTNWKFVPCPVMGNIVLQVKNGNNNEFFLQNSILAIKSVSRGGDMATMQKYGAWHFGSALNAGDMLTLTDAANRTVTIKVPGTAMGQNQDTGSQFPACQ